MQFYLDQQIRRGTFEGALETVKELGVAVSTMEQELVSLRQEIRRNVVEALDKPDYRRMLNRMTQQLPGARNDNLIKLVRKHTLTWIRQVIPGTTASWKMSASWNSSSTGLPKPSEAF